MGSLCIKANAAPAWASSGDGSAAVALGMPGRAGRACSGACAGVQRGSGGSWHRRSRRAPCGAESGSTSPEGRPGQRRIPESGIPRLLDTCSSSRRCTRSAPLWSVPPFGGVLHLHASSRHRISRSGPKRKREGAQSPPSRLSAQDDRAAHQLDNIAAAPLSTSRPIRRPHGTATLRARPGLAA